MSDTAPTKGRDKTTARWLVEGLLIVFSVAVGFAASEYHDSRENRQLANTVLVSMRKEIENNLAVLDTLMEQHRAWQKALATVDPTRSNKSAFDILFEFRPGDVSIGVPLRHGAWDTAVSTGALKLLDYNVAAALSEIYSYQELMTENHNRFMGTVLYSPATFDPASRVASVRVLNGVMGEIAGNESALRDLYKKHLPILQAATPPR